MGQFLERVIQKGLDMKNPSILMMAMILGTHLSVYSEFHEFMLMREFIAYALGLLEPNNSEFLRSWKMDRLKQKDVADGGEGLLFLSRIMSNTGIVTNLAVILLNNLCASKQLARIIGQLPVKYGAKPLAKLFLIDRAK